MGNVHGRTGKDDNEKEIVIGSHYDTVVNAGKYDGTVGIVSAITAAKYLNLKLKKKKDLEQHNKSMPPLHLIAFSDEEGIRFHVTC